LTAATVELRSRQPTKRKSKMERTNANKLLLLVTTYHLLLVTNNDYCGSTAARLMITLLFGIVPDVTSDPDNGLCKTSPANLRYLKHQFSACPD
jgi:hypothetical protein